MNTWFYLVLIGFAVVLVVHSWLLMSLSQKYEQIGETQIRRKVSKKPINYSPKPQISEKLSRERQGMTAERKRKGRPDR